jgi:uracil-DNA glycosylase
MTDAVEVVEAVASDMIKAVARPAKRTSELASIFLPAGSTSKRQKTSDAPASPFSLPAFRDGLSTKGTAPTEADLLALECDTLHESWLALLAPELRKDYFLAMKRSLWALGVHGKDTPVKTTGVFPPGELKLSG